MIWLSRVYIAGLLGSRAGFDVIGIPRNQRARVSPGTGGVYRPGHVPKCEIVCLSWQGH